MFLRGRIRKKKERKEKGGSKNKRSQKEGEKTLGQLESGDKKRGLIEEFVDSFFKAYACWTNSGRTVRRR